MFVRLLMLCWLFCSPMLLAKSLQLESSGWADAIDLNEFVYVLQPSEPRDWQQVSQEPLRGKFRPLKKGNQVQKANAAAFWLYWAIDMPSQQAQSVQLQFDHDFAQYIELYQFQQQQLHSHLLSGAQVDLARRASMLSNYNFPIVLQPGSNEFYLKVNANMPADFHLQLVNSVQQERRFYIKAISTGLFVFATLWLMSTQAWLVAAYDRAIAASSLTMMLALVVILAANANLFSIIFLQSAQLDRYMHYAAALLFTFVLLIHAFLYGERCRFIASLTLYISACLLLLLLLSLFTVFPVAWLIISVCALNLVICFVLLNKVTHKAERSFYMYLGVLCCASSVLIMYFLVINHVIDYADRVFWFAQSFIAIIASLMAFELRCYYYEKIKQDNPSYQAVPDQHWPLLRKINHDLRGPINGVLGMGELMQSTTLSENQKEYLNSIMNSGYDLLGQVDELQNFVRVGLNTLPEQTNKIEIHHFVEQLIEPYARMAEAKHIEVIINIAPNLPSRIVINQKLTQQVMRSLLDNALKYTPTGEIEIQVAVTPSEQIRFAVRNTGEPIGKDKLDTIFEFTRFAQLQHKEVPSYGLPLAKVLVDRMGGTFEIEQLGTGSGVVVFMDLPFKVVASKQAANYDNEQLKQLKVLIVDDNATCRKVLELQLINIGINADTASSGYSALAYMRSAFHKGQPYDVLLLDHKMPNMTGVEVVKRIRDDTKLNQKVNIIMLSGADLTANEGTLKSVSVDSVLNKPVSAVELKQQLFKLQNQPSPSNREP